MNCLNDTVKMKPDAAQAVNKQKIGVFQRIMKSISPKELKAWIDSKKSFHLLDVREKREYEIVHIPGSILFPLRQLTLQQPELDEKKPVVVFCHHGSRSQMACMIMEQLGYKNLYNLTGGIHAYALEVDSSLKTY